MARYAISAEGAASMRILAKQLYTNANSVLESSATLEAKVSAVGDGLGIYEAEILKIIQQGINSLKENQNAILDLAQRVLQKADEIAAITLPDSTFIAEKSTAASTIFGQMTAKKSQYASINDIPQKEYECISNYNSNPAQFNEPMRAGKATNEIKLLSKMISDRELTEDKALFRRATLDDLNGLHVDLNNLASLSGQQYNFRGFMSTSSDAKLPNYVSHGNVFFAFSAPAGINALDLSSLMYNEVIFDSPLCQIVHAERRGNDIYIVASINQYEFQQDVSMIGGV